jgi:hypothetical protein
MDLTDRLIAAEMPKAASEAGSIRLYAGLLLRRWRVLDPDSPLGLLEAFI